MAEMTEAAHELESTTVGIYRTSATVKGGRRFSFAALVVVGDRKGKVGVGYAKGTGVPAAIEKAQKAARKNLKTVTLQEGTLPHPVTASFCASKVRLIPAAPGTGVIAGGTVRAILELAGVKDCLTKAYGSRNQKNLCRAAFNGLISLREKKEIAELRGVDIPDTHVDEILEAGRRFMPEVPDETVQKAKGPVNEIGKNKGKKQRRGGGRGGKPESDAAPQKATGGETATATAEAPAPEAPKAPEAAPEAEAPKETSSE